MVQGWFRDLQQQTDEDHHREWEERSSHSSNRAQRRGRNKMYRHEPSWPRQHQSKINSGRLIFNFWISHSMIIKKFPIIFSIFYPQHPQRYDFRVNTRTAFSSSKTKRLDWRCRWLEDLHPLWFGTTMARWSQATKGTSSSRWTANRSWRYPMPNESTEENTWSKRLISLERTRRPFWWLWQVVIMMIMITNKN